jgi:hypothetical protein
MVAWLFALLIAVCPPGKVPERETRAAALVRYESIAEDIAAEVHASPIYDGARGEAASAALVAAVAIHESGLRLDVDEGITRGDGLDVCILQLRGAPLAVLTDRRACIREGIRRLKRSLRACRSRPPRDRLGVYTSGSCSRGLKESRAMMDLAQRLLAAHPEPEGAS